MLNLILIGGAVLVAGIYPFMWWLSRRLYPERDRREVMRLPPPVEGARFAVDGRPVRAILSHVPPPDVQRALGRVPRVIRGELER